MGVTIGISLGIRNLIINLTRGDKLYSFYVTIFLNNWNIKSKYPKYPYLISHIANTNFRNFPDCLYLLHGLVPLHTQRVAWQWVDILKNHIWWAVELALTTISGKTKH